MNEVDVYYNLHRKCLSVKDRDTGLVVKHTHAIRIKVSKHIGTVRFIVSEKGRKRVLKEGRKNVHAYVRGAVSLGNTPSLEERKLQKPKTLRRVTYNPYKYETFVDAKTGEEVRNAKEVFIDGRNVYVVKEYK
tara:strand:- start:1925 stop:2323 length:399 start_codon:yes stop_codon:yes gene_type:complete